MSNWLSKQSGTGWSGYDRQVWLLFIGTIINVTGMNMVMPFLSIYMYDRMGVSMTMIGLALFIGTALSAVASYAGGALCDRAGRKPMFMAGLVLQVIAFLLISLAIDAGFSYWPMVAVLSIAFVIDGLYRPVPDIMIADMVSPGQRIGAYGLIRVGFNIGAVVGPVLGGALALFSTSYSAMFYVAAFTTLVFLAMVVTMLKDTKPTGSNDTVRLKDMLTIAGDRPFLAFCLLMALLIIPYSQMYSLLSVYSSAYLGFNTLEVGGIFAVSGLMVILFQFPITFAIGRFRMTSALAFGAVVFAAGFGALAISGSLAMVYFCMVVITVAEMVWVPAGATLQANMAPEALRGRYFGFAGLVGSLGYAIGPMFGGLLKDGMSGHEPLMWLVIGATFLISAAGFPALGRILPRAADSPKGAELKPEQVVA
jgi:MFS family permease